jgi:hypothetical protein
MNNHAIRRPRRRRPLALLLTTALLLSLLAGTATANRKTDVVYLKNGDRITGEFKELLQGELKFSTREMGTIYIKWAGIARVESDKYIEFELTDGTKMFGQLPAEAADLERIISLKTLKDEPLVFSMDNVYKAEQIRVNDSFWDRLDGYVKLGINYQQASGVGTLNFAAFSKYRTPTKLTTVDFNSTLTRQNSNDTNRNNLIGSRYWYEGDRWFWFGNLGAQQNEELGLDLRVFAAGGAGRFLAQTQKTEFYLGGGFSANRESETGSDGTNSKLSDAGTNTEALVTFDYTFYKLYSPKSQIKASGTYYQGISDSDRFRGTANLTLRQEVISDLFWDMSFFYDYDSKPLQGAVAREDWGVITSLGYEF